MGRIVKICGVRDQRGVDACLEHRPDYVGFNFAPSSRRRVDPDQAGEWVRRLGEDGPVPVGVFRDQAAGDVMRIGRRSGVRVIQLHGSESPAFCSALGGFELWKALVGPEIDEEVVRSYAQWCDAVIVDGREPGSGEPWDHGSVRDWLDDEGCVDGVPVLVAGGLDPENVARALRASGAAGADAASGVEVDGEVDPKRVGRFVAAVRGEER